MGRLNAILTGMLALSCAACARDAADDAASPTAASKSAPVLAGKYRVSNIDGATIEVDGEKIAASAGCNRLSATYTVDDDGTYAMGPVMQTKMYCEGKMDAEKALVAALSKIARVEGEGGALTLVAADGTPVLELAQEGS